MPRWRRPLMQLGVRLHSICPVVVVAGSKSGLARWRASGGLGTITWIVGRMVLALMPLVIGAMVTGRCRYALLTTQTADQTLPVGRFCRGAD